MSERSRLRLVVLQVLILSLLATLAGRLWYLQVLAGNQYTQAASDNRLREVVTPAVRGLILDDMGRPLASNRSELVVSVDRYALDRMKDGGNAVLHRVAQVLGKPYQQIKDRTYFCGEKGAPKPPVCWNGEPLQPIPVAEGATQAQALQIMERAEDFPGVTAEVQTVRQYPAPDGARTAQVLGYLRPVTAEDLRANPSLQQTDVIGRAGLEAQYDAELRGVPGVRKYAVDRTGAVTGLASETSSQPGNYVVTNIDAKVQAAAENALKQAMQNARTVGDPNYHGRKLKADAGAVVVMDITNGAVIAMASEPDYDPNIWVGPISQQQMDDQLGAKAGNPMINRAMQGLYAPGSVFKVISTAGAVKAGYSVDGIYPCVSAYKIGNSYKKNFESESYGNISLQRAIEVSCDTVFYKFAVEDWYKHGYSTTAQDPFTTTAKQFKIDQKTGIDLPGESAGIVVDRKVKYDTWLNQKDRWCTWARDGYPSSDPARAREITALMRENCTDGWRFGPGDAANFAIGQGETVVTPLTMARVYAAVANGGTLWEPRVAKAIMSPEGKVVKTIPPKSDGKIPVDQRTLDFLHTALAGVATNGTARADFASFPVPAAAKTGTAEVNGKDPTSWFATYMPADKPRYAVVMMVSQGGTGSGISGPQVKNIYRAIYGVQGGTPGPYGLSGGTINLAKAALPNARPPSSLPVVDRYGVIHPPGTKLPPSAQPLPNASPPALNNPPPPLPGASPQALRLPAGLTPDEPSARGPT